MKLLEFTIQNYRSIKTQETFSLLAEAGKSKSDNVFEAPVRKKESTAPLRLLKSAVFYGANASGKSNFIKAMTTLKWLATRSNSLHVEDPIKVYAPFRLDTETAEAPTLFSIVFLIETIKYEYTISFTEVAILEETLSFYPVGKRTNLFKRVVTEAADFTSVTFGAQLDKKGLPINVFNNQAYLSKFGSDVPHQQLTTVYKFFDNLEIWNALDNLDVARLCREVSKTIANGKDEALRLRLSQLIRVADTRIEEVRAIELQEEDFQLPSSLPPNIQAEIIKQNSLRTVAVHNRYEGEQLKDTVEFDLLKEESQGTKVLFALGGIIIEILNEGGILFFDELDNSLHPKLCKFIMELFKNPASNPKGAQLIFATHEASLLDRASIRKDQIWFVEKDRYGSTTFYAASDIEEVREDTNFENWYRIGKFGAVPNIKKMNFLFSTWAENEKKDKQNTLFL